MSTYIHDYKRCILPWICLNNNTTLQSLTSSYTLYFVCVWFLTIFIDKILVWYHGELVRQVLLAKQPIPVPPQTTDNIHIWNENQKKVGHKQHWKQSLQSDDTL